MKRFIFAALLAATPGLAAAAPTVLTFSSDADFNAVETAATYTNRGNASILWGGANQSSFEYAIRAAGEVVQGAPGQIDWADGDHALGPNSAGDPLVRYQPSGQVNLNFRVTEIGDSPNGNPTGDYGLTRTLPIAGVNAVFIRARDAANGTANAALRGLTLSFGNTTVNLGDVIGDGDGEYAGVIDAGLLSGFTLSFAGGDFNFGTGVANAVPALQVKFGTAIIPTPAPAAVGLFGLGLLALGVRRCA